MPSAQNTQALPSFSLALRSDHYTTVLPNLSYPSRHIAHIPWSGSSTAPLLFSVSWTFSFFPTQPYFFFALRKRRVQRRRWLVVPIFKSVIPLFFTNPCWHWRRPFRFPLPRLYVSIPPQSQMVFMESLCSFRWLMFLLTFVFWFRFFSAAPLVSDRWKTQINQTKSLWCPNQPLRHCQRLNSPFRQKKYLCRPWFWVFTFLSITLFEAYLLARIPPNQPDLKLVFLLNIVSIVS